MTNLPPEIERRRRERMEQRRVEPERAREEARPLHPEEEAIRARMDDHAAQQPPPVPLEADSPAVREAVEKARATSAAAQRQRDVMRAAGSSNRAFREAKNPSPAAVAAQLKALTEQVQALTRLVLGEFDAED